MTALPDFRSREFLLGHMRETMAFVCAQVVFVVQMTLTTSSKRVGLLNIRP